MADAKSCLNGLRVLIVEDELLLAMELESLVRRLGCVALNPSPSVPQALRALRKERPDLAVLDVNLQGQRVTPVAEDLNKRGVPFVLVTGYVRQRLSEEALQGAPCLQKPVDHRRLACALSEALAHPRGH